MKSTVTILCNFCKKEIIRIKSKRKYKTSFCNKKCHASFRTANFKLCSVEECGKKSICKKLCQRHYDIFRNTEERKVYKSQKHKEWMDKYKQILKDDDKLNYEFKNKRKEAVRKYRKNNIEKCREMDLQSHKLPKRRYNQAKRSAKKRNITFDISLEFYNNIISPNTKCFYNCGNFIPLSGVGLDRIDNKIGYVENNVVPCCGVCNAIKNSVISKDEMLEIIKLLKNLRNAEYLWEGKSTTHNKNYDYRLDQNDIVESEEHRINENGYSVKEHHGKETQS
jgi:hypothetical protein